MKEQVIPSMINFIGGNELKQLDPKTKLIYAKTVSELLGLYPEHLLQFSPEQIIGDFMDTGDAVLAVDAGRDNLIGFAKNYLWLGKNDQGQPVFEFGSWVVSPRYLDQGFGHKLVYMALDIAKQKFPSAQIVAICASDNPKAVGILKELGAFETVKPTNVKIILGEGQIPVMILEMSKINSK